MFIVFFKDFFIPSGLSSTYTASMTPLTYGEFMERVKSSSEVMLGGTKFNPSIRGNIRHVNNSVINARIAAAQRILAGMVNIPIRVAGLYPIFTEGKYLVLSTPTGFSKSKLVSWVRDVEISELIENLQYTEVEVYRDSAPAADDRIVERITRYCEDWGSAFENALSDIFMVMQHTAYEETIHDGVLFSTSRQEFVENAAKVLGMPGFTFMEPHVQDAHQRICSFVHSNRNIFKGESYVHFERA